MAKQIENNKQTVRSIFEVGLNTGDTELLNRLISPDFVGARGDRGPAAFSGPLLELRRAFPDIHYVLEDVIGEGDQVAIRWTWTGTHRGVFRGFAPNGRTIVNSGIGIFELREGKIVRSSVETDRLGFLQELGALPSELTARLRPSPSQKN